jgi:hypothetical protein
MILVTHGAVGGALAVLSAGNPAVAFAAGFASHFILDAFPHWDYPLKTNFSSGERPAMRSIARDVAVVSLDGIAGLALPVLILMPEAGTTVILAGALGAIAPDFLQFVWFVFRPRALAQLQYFHEWIHTGIRLTGRPFIGVVSQALIIACALLSARAFF